jgi:hypothetical protein
MVSWEGMGGEERGGEGRGGEGAKLKVRFMFLVIKLLLAVHRC